VAVLSVEVLGSSDTPWLAVLGGLVAVAALRPLLPRRTLAAGRGLPAVIGTRGLMSAGFFCGQAYVVLVLQVRWDWSPGHAGLALTVVGVVWASASQVQARLRERVSSETAMRVGTVTLLATSVAMWLTVWLDGPALGVGAAFVVAGAGMGFGFSRTGVAMLAASSDRDRGFNSSALSIADSIGAALALSLCGTGFALVTAGDGDPFLAVFGVAVVASTGAVVAAARTPRAAAVS
jgi:predicted MFS family arabinose efflux permease